MQEQRTSSIVTKEQKCKNKELLI